MIGLEWRDGVALVTLDRQERRNAIDRAALDDLGTAVGAVIDGGVRALVLTGAGGHFSAGADLTSLEDAGFATHLRGVLELLAGAPLVTLAAVDGAALGLGTQLATACDLRMATPAARFGIPAARLGLMVDARTVQRLVALAGHGPARSMLLAAEVVTGEEALRLGLAQRLGGLDDALAWAGEIAALAPLTVVGHKLTLERLLPPIPPDDAVEAAFTAAWASDDLAEGRAAFAERRPPRFEGR